MTIEENRFMQMMRELRHLGYCGYAMFEPVGAPLDF
jgi:hypothetical protein